MHPPRDRSNRDDMELLTMPQTEDARNTGDQRLPASDVAGGKRSPKHWLALSIALIAVGALLVSGIWSRVKARTALTKVTEQSAVTAVSVVSPRAIAPTDEIILPGNVQPFITSPIYAHKRLPEEVVLRYWSAR